MQGNVVFVPKEHIGHDYSSRSKRDKTLTREATSKIPLLLAKLQSSNYL